MKTVKEGYFFIVKTVATILFFIFSATLTAYLWLSGMGITIDFRHLLAATVLILMSLFLFDLALLYARVKYNENKLNHY